MMDRAPPNPHLPVELVVAAGMLSEPVEAGLLLVDELPVADVPVSLVPVLESVPVVVPVLELVVVPVPVPVLVLVPVLVPEVPPVSTDGAATTVRVSVAALLGFPARSVTTPAGTMTVIDPRASGVRSICASCPSSMIPVTVPSTMPMLATESAVVGSENSTVTVMGTPATGEAVAGMSVMSGEVQSTSTLVPVARLGMPCKSAAAPSVSITVTRPAVSGTSTKL